MSVNHTVFRSVPNVPLIATFEIGTWSFQDGTYTDPITGAPHGSSGTAYVGVGPGLRLVVCDRMGSWAGDCLPRPAQRTLRLLLASAQQ